MAYSLSVTVDESVARKVLKAFDQLTRKSLAIAIQTGLLKAARQGRTVAKKQITSVYNVKSGAVAETLSVYTRRTAGSSLEGLSAFLSSGRKGGKNRIPLILFSARDPLEGKKVSWQKRNKGRGVTVKIKKREARARLKHAFIATMKSGNRGVFQRDPVTGKIRSMSGMDVVTMFASKSVILDVSKKIDEALARTVPHEIDRAIQKDIDRYGDDR